MLQQTQKSGNKKFTKYLPKLILYFTQLSLSLHQVVGIYCHTPWFSDVRCHNSKLVHVQWKMLKLNYIIFLKTS